MRSPREIYVRQLHEELGQWASKGKLEIRGRINASRDRDKAEEAFAIATAKDARGSVLRLGPMPLPAVLTPKSDKDKDKDTRAWLQWWTKVAVRSGYRAPEIDPEAFRALLRVRDEGRSRFEFIFDTNALISGVGHWLVRMLGDRCDLVRTVVSDLEIHDKADSVKIGNTIGSMGELADRATWLAASRFMERVPHDRPIWRRLDTGEETALFVAGSSVGGKKSGGRDTLLLRASRREILDQVPRLHRFFVTDDKNVARAALHDLPQGSVIATCANPLTLQVLHLSPHLWLPVGDNDQGSVVASNLAEFLWEALCVCAELEIQRADGVVWRLRAYKAGANQFPSDWADPRLFIEEDAPGIEPKKEAESSKAEVGADAPAAANVAPATVKTHRNKGHVAQPEKTEARPVAAAGAGGKAPEPDKTAGVGKGVAPWPLKKENAELLEPGPPVEVDCPGPLILRAFGEIVTAIRAKREPDFESFLVGKEFDIAPGLHALLESGKFLDKKGHVASSGAELPVIFAANDLDRLSYLCTAFEVYHEVIQTLQVEGRVPFDMMMHVMLDSSYHCLELARSLGQAASDNVAVYDGSRWINPTAFIRWLLMTFNTLAEGSPLREVLVANLALRAAYELHLSPFRFGRALVAALTHPELSLLEPTAGGEDKLVLVEQVASLSADGSLHFVTVSADGLHGMRALKKRPR